MAPPREHRAGALRRRRHHHAGPGAVSSNAGRFRAAGHRRRGARLTELYDSHCHLDFAALDKDRAGVWARARAAGVTRILVPGVDPPQWARAAALRVPAEVFVRCAAGIHPWALADADPDAMLAALPSALDDLDAAAVGELGWDRPLARRGGVDLDEQDRVARAQLALARARELPVILHVVGAHGRALGTLADTGCPHGGVVHAYSGSAELVGRYVELGLHLSFGPSITRPTAAKVRAAAARTPLDRLLVETDAPDQFPRGNAAPGEPADLPAVLAAVAAATGRTKDELARRTGDNAAALFG